MANSSNCPCHLVVILIIIILSFIPGCLSKNTNDGTTADLDNENVIDVAFIVDISNINMNQISSRDTLVIQMNQYLALSTSDVRVRSVSLNDTFVSNKKNKKNKNTTSLCDIEIDDIFLKSKRFGILIVSIHIEKFPGVTCGIECQKIYIAKIENEILSNRISALVIMMETGNCCVRLVPAQFCYLVNPVSSTYNPENACLCTIGLNGTNLTTSSSVNLDQSSGTKQFLITFGFGTNLYSNKTPADFGFTTEHVQVDGWPGDGRFTISNKIPEFLFWHSGALDHTVNETNGYMFVVNALPSPGLYFKKTINNLTVGRIYEFSTYAADVNPPGWASSDILFQVRTASSDNTLIAERSSGNIPAYANMTWNKYGISFVASSTSVNLLMIAKSTDFAGNDIAFDDIGLCEC